MKNMSVQKCMYVLSMVLLVTLFAACSDPSSASGVTPTPTTADTIPTPTTAANQPAPPTSVTGTGKAPTTVAKATSATTANQPAPPTSVVGTGTDFQSFTGVDFTILYPAKWQKTHKVHPAQGSGSNYYPEANTYGFVAQDNITGFHIERRLQEQAVGGSAQELTGSELLCDYADKKGQAEDVTVGGIGFGRLDLICTGVGSNKYEIHELVHNSNDKPYGPTVIMYGAVASDFAHAKVTYFDPMLASFKFN